MCRHSLRCCCLGAARTCLISGISDLQKMCCVRCVPFSLLMVNNYVNFDKFGPMRMGIKGA